MAELYEVLLLDAGRTWHAGFVVDDATETDVLLRSGSHVPLFSARAALEHHVQGLGLELEDDLPDEIDLDLGGWLTTGTPAPVLAEILELWQLLYDDPDARRALRGEQLGEAYDDLIEDAAGWHAEHGARTRPALTEAVRRLRAVLRPC